MEDSSRGEQDLQGAVEPSYPVRIGNERRPAMFTMLQASCYLSVTGWMLAGVRWANLGLK
jgi:hypothetical protein